ncbi:MAG: hypothetical protein AB1813_04510 [Verrucomicrobiota bacterium]|jgi:hypothetical protein
MNALNDRRENAVAAIAADLSSRCASSEANELGSVQAEDEKNHSLQTEFRDGR